MNTAEAAYLAGIIDGEGSVFLFRKRNGAALRLTVSQTTLPLLRWCETTTAVGSVVAHEPGNEKHKTSMWWQANAQAAESVLQQTLPYMIVKREQAELALDFMRRLRIPADKANGEWQEAYRLRMAALNKRGPAEAAA